MGRLWPAAFGPQVPETSRSKSRFSRSRAVPPFSNPPGDSGRLRPFLGNLGTQGGITIDAGVDEAILYLQCGHGAGLPARAYMQLSSPARFLETFGAFGL
jgi:hypothetical protein